MKIPCEGCICLPLCRHKPYVRLITDCNKLLDLLDLEEDYGRKSNYEYVREIELRVDIMATINPSKWSVDKFGYFDRLKD